MTTIPPETIIDETSGIQVANRDREYYNQGWNDCAIKANALLQTAQTAFTQFIETIKRNTPYLAPFLERMAENAPEALEITPSQTVVQAGTELVDNAMKDLLNHECIPYFDYLTIGDIEKWLKGKGSPYLAALVEAIRTAR